jgi:DNA-binding transcriptional LysR family regulator
MDLNQFELFQQIVEQGSLVAAGRELGLSAATVTERLAALEKHYGVTLLNRTTRAISLTDEGRTLLDGARQVLTAAEELEHRIRLGAETLSGTIRVSAPFDLGRSVVKPVVDEFLADNPQISIELLLSDGYVNIVDEGIDVALRLGSLADSTLRVRNLGQNRRLVCASPVYLERHGEPRSPDELKQHNCLVMRFGTELDNLWHFQKEGKKIQVVVSGNRIANEGRLAHDWCLEGQGIALKSIWDVESDIESGALVRLLDEYLPAPTTLQMLFPPNRSRPRRVREFTAKLAAAFQR